MLCIKNVKLPKSCGSKCTFCLYDSNDDMYKCVFFKKSNIEQELVNEAVIYRSRYVNCPIICEIIDNNDEAIEFLKKIYKNVQKEPQRNF